MKLLVLLQMLTAPAMLANLLTNGGFELPVVTGRPAKLSLSGPTAFQAG